MPTFQSADRSTLRQGGVEKRTERTCSHGRRYRGQLTAGCYAGGGVGGGVGAFMKVDSRCH